MPEADMEPSTGSSRVEPSSTDSTVPTLAEPARAVLRMPTEIIELILSYIPLHLRGEHRISLSSTCKAFRRASNIKNSLEKLTVVEVAKPFKTVYGKDGVCKYCSGGRNDSFQRLRKGLRNAGLEKDARPERMAILIWLCLKWRLFKD